MTLCGLTGCKSNTSSIIYDLCLYLLPFICLQIAKILHCYVFPAVTFQIDDIPILEECMRIIVLKQKAIEREMVDTEKNVAITDQYLSQQKRVLLANDLLTKQLYLQACSTEFVHMFYVHVTKDIQSKNMKLDILQVKINDLKRGGEGRDQERLGRLKQERDALHEAMQKLLTVREAIRNHLYRPHNIPKKKRRRQKKEKIDEKEASLHTMFREVHQRLVTGKDQLKRLCYRKLHTASVREAIESTVQILKRYSPRCATALLGDFSEFSVHPEAGQESSREPWRSMQAMVDGWMSGDGPLRRAHQEGCQLVKDLATSMLSDSGVGVDPAEVELLEIPGRQAVVGVGDLSGAVDPPQLNGVEGVGNADGQFSVSFNLLFFKLFF